MHGLMTVDVRMSRRLRGSLKSSAQNAENIVLNGVKNSHEMFGLTLFMEGRARVIHA
jgi:hypothetical protein